MILAGTKDDIFHLRNSFTAEEIMEIEIVAEIDVEHQPISALTCGIASTFGQPGDLRRRAESHESAAGGHRRLRDQGRGGLARRRLHPHGYCAAGFRCLRQPAPCGVFRTTPAVSWALLLKDLIDRHRRDFRSDSSVHRCSSQWRSPFA